MSDANSEYPVNAQGYVENWETQVCRTCGKEKRLTEFYRHPHMANGFLLQCKACKLEATHERRMKDLDAARERDRKMWKKRVKNGHTRS